MGVFKEVKEMNEMVPDAPNGLEQARQMAASPYVFSRRATHESQPSPPLPAAYATPAGSDFDPIGSVSLETYALISKSLATVDNDLSKTIRLAGEKGVSEESWTLAVAGWNARMAANPSVRTRYSDLYEGT